MTTEDNHEASYQIVNKFYLYGDYHIQLLRTWRCRFSCQLRRFYSVVVLAGLIGTERCI